MHYGKWDVKSINLSTSSTTEFRFHSFFDVSKYSTITHSILYLNDVSSVTFYQTGGYVKAFECNLLNNTDHGNYHNPGLCYSNEYEYYITKCNFVGNKCKWLFFCLNGFQYVTDTYVADNEYITLSTFQVTVNSTNLITNEFIITIKTYDRCEQT